MKNLILIITALILLFLNSCRISKTNLSKHEEQKKYLPEQFHDLYLGMPLAKFKKVKDMSKLIENTVMSFRYVYEENINDDSIKTVTYYLDKDNNRPLYELIIEYQPDFNLADYIENKYGSPNSGSEWVFLSGEKFIIRIWTFENTLVIAGVIRGTEWSD